jgi:hemolysin D
MMKRTAWLAPADPRDFAPALLRLQERAPHPLGRKVLWSGLTMAAVLLAWALVGRVDIVAVAEGKLVPGGYVKIVQPSEGGVVQQILVTEGETVGEGQVLMRMDRRISQAEGRALQAEHDRKRLVLRRIDAELAGQPFRPQQADPAALAAEVAAQHAANRAALDSALAEESARMQRATQELAAAEQVRAKLREILPHFDEQEKAFVQLGREGFAGPIMVGDKRRERIEKEQELKAQDHVIEAARASMLQSEKKLAAITASYRRTLFTEREEASGALDKLTQELAKHDHRHSMLELRAPQAGIVKELGTHTSGTVVQPGTVLVTLVPKDAALSAEVWITNEDIGFVSPGTPVKLKLVAYPFQKFGTVDGRVRLVSADATDKAGDTPARPSPLAYKAIVDLRQDHLAAQNERLPLAAGMQAQADLLLGTRTVAEYLLSPVTKAWREAARER